MLPTGRSVASDSAGAPAGASSNSIGMTPWILLRHDTPDGSWHFDWMLATAPADSGLPLMTFRVALRPDQPGTDSFDAERIGDHRAAYLTFEGPLTEGRGSVRREASGTCRVRQNGSVLIVELIEPNTTWVGAPRVPDTALYRFERADARRP